MKFKVNLSEDIFETNPELRSIPDFADKTDRQLKYVFLTYDYQSPYKDLALSKRKEVVAKAVGFRMEKNSKGVEVRWDKNARVVLDGKNETIENIRKVFMSNFQDNADRRVLAAYQSQIDQWSEFLHKPEKTDKENEQAIKIMKELKNFLKEKKALMEIVGLQEDGDKENITRDLSEIDEINMEG